MVALGRGMQPVDRLHGDVDGGVEAEGEIRGAQVVVDGLRHADDLAARLAELVSDAEGVLAADRDERVNPEAVQVLLDPLDARFAVHRVGLGHRIGPGGAQDRAAPGQDAADCGHVQDHRVALKRTAPAVPEADELHLVLGYPGPHYRTADRVQPGTIAASGEDSDSHDAPSRVASRHTSAYERPC